MQGLGGGMSNVSPPSALSSLQARFAILDIPGDIRVVDLDKIHAHLQGALEGEIGMYKKQDAELKMKRHLEALAISSNPRQVIADFWISPATVEYKATAFSPNIKSPSILNFWVGPVPKPQPGNWVVLREFIKDVICGSQEEAYSYLIQYMAHMVQKPEEKPGIIVTLIGGQGTGKGVYFSLLRAIWKSTTIQVSTLDHIVGRFNAILERNYVICMDEALFAGDRRSLDRMKSMITEPNVMIEQKLQPVRSIESVHRFFAASNHDHFAHVDRDDRRFLFLRVSDSHKQDTAYFKKITAEISDDRTIGALFYYLLRKDISDFNIRIKPKTSEHLAQRLKSLEGFERFWYEVLSIGLLDGVGTSTSLLSDFNTPWLESIFVSSNALLESYKNFNKNAQRYQTLQNKNMKEQLVKLCPSVKADRQQIRVSGQSTSCQQRGFILPTLPLARQEFCAYIGGELEWD